MTFCMERHHREYKILHRMGHLFFAEIATIILAPYMVFCNKISSTSSICCFLTRYGKIFATTSLVWPCLFLLFMLRTCLFHGFMHEKSLWALTMVAMNGASSNSLLTQHAHHINNFSQSFFGLPFWGKKCTFSLHVTLCYISLQL